MKDLLTIDQIGAEGIQEIMVAADSFAEVCQRPIPKVPALRGKTVATMFFEDSTRTRTSFETAAKRLSADILNFSASSSSVNKGESLRDTVETIEAMGVDAIVVRHGSSGAPEQISRWASASVINGGDGWHAHPTQSLLDVYTIREEGRSFEGLRIAIVGDIAHSRVARSNIEAFRLLGAEVTVVAPPTLLPPHVEALGAKVSNDLDAVLAETDVLYLLRMQHERMDQALVPSLGEYHRAFGLTPERAKRLSSSALIMHPGPMNRGIEISPEVIDDDRVRVLNQVTNGVIVRMAVLYLVIGSAAADRLGS
ncbi:MAG: aspartate carbamoyltransferase catalytic subunit [Acidimicrobiia bacterium]|nr:aspartate carbamoyltransferase catalytic subunit [Acidimicrobiia bacterium]